MSVEYEKEELIKVTQLTDKIQVEKRIHAIWENSQKLGLRFPTVGQFHYIYSSDKGKISLIKLEEPWNTENPWEIYALENMLFEDIEKYESKERAEERIKELLQ